MSARSKSIEFRASSPEKERLTAAAKTLGLDLSSFIRMVALREAERLELENAAVSLSKADLEFLLDSLEEDPRPTPRLVSLFTNRS